MPAWNVRPVRTDADARAYLEVRNRVEPADPVSAASFEEARRRQDRLDLLATLDGKPVGMGFVGRNVENAQSRFSFGKVGVLASHRRKGLGTILFRELGRFGARFAPDGMVIETREADVDTVSYLTRRGYERVFRIEELTLDVASASGHVSLPAGITLRPFDRVLARAVYDACSEIERDLPAVESQRTPPFNVWSRAVLTDDLVARCSILGLDAADCVVGLALAYARPWGALHGLTGVRRAWRRRGLARALKVAQIEQARALGLAELRTTNEENNVAIRRLNAELGYVATLAWVQLRGPYLVGAD